MRQICRFGLAPGLQVRSGASCLAEARDTMRLLQSNSLLPFHFNAERNMLVTWPGHFCEHGHFRKPRYTWLSRFEIMSNE